MKKWDCVYIERTLGDCNRVCVTECNFGDVKQAKVLQLVKKDRRKVEKENRQLIRVLKKNCAEKTVVVGNERTVQELGLTNYLFQMRKREMESRLVDILKGVKGEDAKKRKSCLLLIESDKWNQRDVTGLLWIIKEQYEDIYLSVQTSDLSIESIETYFYEEYGLVIHVVNEKVTRQLQVDMGLFLVERWKESYKKYSVRTGYVVAEWEGEMKRKRKAIQREPPQVLNPYLVYREWYAGFVYEWEGKPISYETGVLLANNLFLKEKICKSTMQNPISVVAIYGVE